MGHGLGGGCVQVTFVWTVEFSHFSQSVSVHTKCQRLWEQIAEGTYLEHQETYWEQQIPSLDVSGAGTMDSRSAVGLSGC